MGDCESLIPTCEAEQHLIAAAQHILRALGTNQNLNKKVREILANLNSELCAITESTQGKEGHLTEVEKQLRCVEEKIRRWDGAETVIWDSCPAEAYEYLKAVNELQRLAEELRSLSLSPSQKHTQLLCQADSILQMAMSRLEKELIHVLTQHKQYFEPQHVSFRSCGDNVVYDESIVSFEENTEVETSQRDDFLRDSEEKIVDLVHPHVIPYLKSIANAMIALDYGQEFCQAFISTRRNALHHYLFTQELEAYSLEDLLKMEWDALNRGIKKWIRVMKIIQGYLASEKRLCDQILEGFGSVNHFCFVETSKASILGLLHFGMAVAMGPRRPERLFRLLDMYEVMAGFHSHIDVFFVEDTGLFLKSELGELLRSLGEASRAIFMELSNYIASHTSVSPFPGGRLHHLTRYVMNYLGVLTIYVDTLNFLLHTNGEDSDRTSERWLQRVKVSVSSSCPMASQLHLIASSLISNLHIKSKLYKDDALQHIFLMNNIHYIVQKIKNSELRIFFGDDWIKEQTVMFQQHATKYARATWGSVLSLLKGDGFSGINSVFNSGAKEKCRAFTLAFEEIYKNQTGWFIPHLQLREDLQISTSKHLIHAYRDFLGKNSLHIHEKYIKYSEDDLGNYILDLFQGSPRSLYNPRRK